MGGRSKFVRTKAMFTQRQDDESQKVIFYPESQRLAYLKIKDGPSIEEC